MTPRVLSEFVHVVTDARRFDPPVSITEAIETTKLYIGRSNAQCVSEDGASVELAFQWISDHKLGRKRIADSLIAATFVRDGIHRLLTCNAADFQIFQDLTTIDPLSD